MLLLGNWLGWLNSSVAYSSTPVLQCPQFKFMPQQDHKQVEGWMLEAFFLTVLTLFGEFIQSRGFKYHLYTQQPPIYLQPGPLFWTPDSHNKLPTWRCHQHVQWHLKLNTPETVLPIFHAKLLILVNGNSTIFSRPKKPGDPTPPSHSAHNSWANLYN